jgi:hypothetical protein
MRELRNLERRLARLERLAHTMTKKDRERLDELQLLEDRDALSRAQSKEYEALVEEYRLTDEFKKNQRKASSNVSMYAKKALIALDELESELGKTQSWTHQKSGKYSYRWNHLRAEIADLIMDIQRNF